MFHHHDRTCSILSSSSNSCYGNCSDAILEPFKLVRDASEPLNVVATAVPVTVIPVLSVWSFFASLKYNSVCALGLALIYFTLPN